ncbi:MAG: DNA-binding protein [Nanoarchaeota archaeon]|nr:DNA-binding protein [Nanoarchaeota archaeon]
MSDSKKSKDAEDILSEFHDTHVSSEPEPALSSPEPEPALSSPDTKHDPEERDVIFVGNKPIMTYVSATLTQLSTRHTVTIKARGKKITQAVDVSQMIVKRMNTVGYVISDVRILSDSLLSQDGKLRNVSTIEIDITKN